MFEDDGCTAFGRLGHGSATLGCIDIQHQKLSEAR